MVGSKICVEVCLQFATICVVFLYYVTMVSSLRTAAASICTSNIKRNVGSSDFILLFTILFYSCKRLLGIGILLTLLSRSKVKFFESLVNALSREENHVAGSSRRLSGSTGNIFFH